MKSRSRGESFPWEGFAKKYSRRDERESSQTDVGETAPAEPAAIVPLERLKPEFRGDAPAVLCLGAHSPIDAAAADSLAQLSRRYGIPARADAVIRLSDLANLDLKGVKLIWIISSNPEISHAKVRYIVRRLLRYQPDATIFGAFAAANTESDTVRGVAKWAPNFATAIRMTAAAASIDDAVEIDQSSKEQSLPVSSAA